jgi:hypothetical protein
MFKKTLFTNGRVKKVCRICGMTKIVKGRQPSNPTLKG